MYNIACDKIYNLYPNIDITNSKHVNEILYKSNIPKALLMATERRGAWKALICYLLLFMHIQTQENYLENKM